VRTVIRYSCGAGIGRKLVHHRRTKLRLNRCVFYRDQGIAGSNPVSPTNAGPRFDSGFRIGRGLLFSRLPRFGPQVDQTANVFGGQVP
jgi:hypothetical protein